MKMTEEERLKKIKTMEQRATEGLERLVIDKKRLTLRLTHLEKEAAFLQEKIEGVKKQLAAIELIRTHLNKQIKSKVDGL